MGNSINRKKEKSVQSTTNIFSAKLEEERSLTVPSICSNFSYSFSTQQLPDDELSSKSFTWSQMQNLCLQHQTTAEEPLTPQVLKTAAQVLEQLNRHVPEICNDLQIGLVLTTLYGTFCESVKTF